MSALSDELCSQLDAWAQERGLFQALEPYESFRMVPEAAGLPQLHLEDVSAIPGVAGGVPGVERYQHRARIRARQGDVYAAVIAPPDGYEHYNQQFLGFGPPDFVLAEAVTSALEVVEACRHGAAFERLAQLAAQRGGLVIHPYMGIEPVWHLARELRERTRAAVHVLAPPTPSTWLANDKSSFDALVKLCLGPGYTVDSEEAEGLEATTAALERMAQRHQVVGLKRLRSASAMGNQVIRQSDLAKDGARSLVERFFEATHWCNEEKAQVVAWMETDLSPSTQIWIPPLGQGSVRLDGIYEQLLEGEEKVFLGSRPARFDEGLTEALTSASLRLGEALQRLGYQGRCSFDTLVLQGEGTVPQLYFTECNGRWGGTSTPMHLVDRLFPDARPLYRAQDYMHAELVGLPFAELKDRLGQALYDHRTGSGRYILYNVGPLEDRGKFDVIVLGRTVNEVDQAIAEELPGLLGL